MAPTNIPTGPPLASQPLQAEAAFQSEQMARATTAQQPYRLFGVKTAGQMCFAALLLGFVLMPEEPFSDGLDSELLTQWCGVINGARL